MPIYALDEDLVFPPPHLAEPDGMLAVGGDLSPNRILLAYTMGIFPWYSEDEPILWWSPDPRFVMYPKDIKVSKSMKQVFKKKEFTITIDQDFEGVVKKCQKMYRPGQYGTWITDDMLAAYCTLHQAGFAHSVETWDDDHNLVGGLYGMAIGKCFFGESMFAEVSNASKAAYVRLVQQLALWGFSLIDCQVYTKHLESLGAVKISRYLFLNQLENALQQPFKPGKWHFDEETP